MEENLEKQDEVEEKENAKSEEALIKSMSYVPYGVRSFEQYDKYEETQNTVEKAYDMFGVYFSIASNLMYDLSMPDSDRDVIKELRDLTQEFVKRLSDVSTDSEFKETKSLYTSDSVAIYKDSDDTMRWLGIPTNKYIDRDAEPNILSDKAHRRFVKMLDKGEVPMPDLYIWHIEKAVGKATWVDYDERGFLVAGGTINKEYQDFVEKLLTNSSKSIGMSHGMYKNTIKRNANEPHIFDEYVSHEFTFLPADEAANELTAFNTVE